MHYQKHKVNKKIFRFKIINDYIVDLFNQFEQHPNKTKICLATLEDCQKPSRNVKC